ncbi:hypothetical protein PFISCL1PPCAC_4961, partial [Pristionchus fissidentatus]
LSLSLSLPLFTEGNLHRRSFSYIVWRSSSLSTLPPSPPLSTHFPHSTHVSLTFPVVSAMASEDCKSIDATVDIPFIPIDKNVSIGSSEGSRRSTLTQREPPNPVKKKRKIVAFCALVLVALTVWSCVAAYHVVKHLVWGPEIVIEETEGSEIIVPNSEVVPFSEIRWTPTNIEIGSREEERMNRSTIACFLHAQKWRVPQALSSTQTWLPNCDYHALLTFSQLKAQLATSPHIIVNIAGKSEVCLDLLSIYLASKLFPDADWIFLAPDDSFVMVDRLREWIDNFPRDDKVAVDLSDARPSFIINKAAVNFLNVSECESDRFSSAHRSFARLLERVGLESSNTFDSLHRSIVLDKKEMDRLSFTGKSEIEPLSPLLSIIKNVSPSEVQLLNHIHNRDNLHVNVPVYRDRKVCC